LAGAADKVLCVKSGPDYLLHLEFQSGPFAARLPDRLGVYNAVLRYRHRLPVRSVLVLLHPGADSPQWTGLLEHSLPDETPYFRLRYDILRVWQVPVKRLLAGGIATLPLALISDVAQAELPAVIDRMRERLDQGPERQLAPELWTASFVLLGMRRSLGLAQQLLREVLNMVGSVTYRAIVEEGELIGARRVLLRLGKKYLGKPDRPTAEVLTAITELERLEELSERVPEASSWEALLSAPRPRRRKARS
jgi:hypothetical protein